MSSQEGPDYTFIRRQLETGKVIPFIGSAVSSFATAPPSPPTTIELARQLVENTDFPQGETLDLAKVAQYLKAVGGPQPLYDRLHAIFNQEYGASTLHSYLARVSATTPLLIVTTNYDDLIERAFAQVPHDTVVHICNPKLGDCVYWRRYRPAPTGGWAYSEPQKIVPNKLNIDLSANTVIYKMHGTVDRQQPTRDQYVIAEDDYIDFLTRMTKNRAIPAVLAASFPARHFLFLGYGLRDWNLRVVLNRIQKSVNGTSDYMSWAIQHQPSPLERRFWERRDVVLFDLDLNEFVQRLTQ